MRKDEPCQFNCTFIKCVDDLNNVISKATLYQLKNFVQNNCQTALFRRDTSGRYPIHVAASCGNIDILNWIVSLFSSKAKEVQRLTVNILDKESGWTALHRAAYYGRIPLVVSLLKQGADLWIRDKDGCNILDIMVKDISPWYRHPVLRRNSSTNHVLKKWCDLHTSGPNDIFVWGANENMTLGNSSAKSKFTPETVTMFVRKKLSVKQVVMCKYHSLFLTHCGNVYACGNGRDGRFGIEKESVLIEPRQVHFDEVIVCIAASTNHSVFVSESGQVYTCGSNQFCVLGIKPPPPKCLQPTLVTALYGHNIIGCAAGFCHTVVWSLYGLFTFGTNAGQLGHGKGELSVIEPREVSQFHGEDTSFVHVHACDAATVVATAQGMIYLLHKYYCRKILTRHMDVVKVEIGGGCLDPDVLSQVKSFHMYRPSYKVAEKESQPIRILILKSTGHVLSWSGQHYSIDHCQFNNNQLQWVRDVSISRNGSVVMLVSIDGTAYRAEYGNWIPKKKKPRQEYFSSLELSQSDSIQKFHTKQVACAFRAHTAYLGPKGSNSALLQCRPSSFITQVPVIDPSNIYEDLSEFLRNSTETDLIHDVQIRVKRYQQSDVFFPAHLFILASRSKYLAKLILDQYEERRVDTDYDSDDEYGSDPWPDLIVENVYSEIFEEFLSFLYSNQSFLLEDNNSSNDDLINSLGSVSVYWEGSNKAKPSKSKKKLGKTDRKSLLKGLLTHMEVNYQTPLAGARDSNDSDSDSNLPEPRQRPVFSPFTLIHLYDCVVECCDSISFNAHKCLLAARIPYFAAMLFSPWIQVDQKIAALKVPLPSDVFRFVLKFSYSDSETSLNDAKTIEVLCETLGAADLLLMDRMKQAVEAHIVPYLTLKNVASVCDVALAFNATQLHDSCLQFCCHHLPALLQTPSFFSINDDSLKKLEDVYRSLLPSVFMRAMPPSSEGPCIDYYPQSGDDLDDRFLFIFEKEKLQNKPSSKRKKSLSESERKKSSESSKSMGVLVSDLLKKRNRNEKKVLESIKDEEKKTALKVKKPSKKKTKASNLTPQPTTTTTSDNNNCAKEVREHDVMSDVPTSPSVDQLKSYANYNRLFPQLGAEPSKPRFDLQNVVTPSSRDGKPSLVTGASGAEISKSKKLSKKERRRQAARSELKESSSAIDIKQSPSNVWGVPLKSPEHTGNHFPSPLDSDRLSVSPVYPQVAKLPTPEKKGPWQSLPVSTFGSPPNANFRLVDSSSSLSSKPSSFMDIVKDEIKTKELLQDYKSKSMDLIQLEDSAMFELKKFYEKSNKSSHAYITVSRLPADVAREISELRISTKK